MVALAAALPNGERPRASPKVPVGDGGYPLVCLDTPFGRDNQAGRDHAALTESGLSVVYSFLAGRVPPIRPRRFAKHPRRVRTRRVKWAQSARRGASPKGAVLGALGMQDLLTAKRHNRQHENTLALTC